MQSNSLPHHHHKSEELLKKIPDLQDFSIVSDLFKMLSDETRLRIFWILCHSEECVINISALMNMSSPAVAHHLRKLKNTKLITSRKEGKEVYYKAANTNEANALHHMIEDMMEISCPQ